MKAKPIYLSNKYLLTTHCILSTVLSCSHGLIMIVQA